jgi:hypothetical protein
MPLFSYIARSMSGETVRGSVSASSGEDAREHLRKQNLLVEELQEERAAVPVREDPTRALSKIWEDIPSEPHLSPAEEVVTDEYAPFVETLRLFAGWLLAWYAAVYAFGSYQWMRELPVTIPFIEGLFLSPLVLRLTFGTFLFLLLSTVHKALGGGIGRGIIVTIVGVFLFAFFHVNA